MKVLSKIFSSKFIFQNVVQAGALVHGPHSFVDSTRVHAGEEVDHHNHHHHHHVQHIYDNFRGLKKYLFLPKISTYFYKNKYLFLQK